MKGLRIEPARYMEPAKIIIECSDGELVIPCQQYNLHPERPAPQKEEP